MHIQAKNSLQDSLETYGKLMLKHFSLDTCVGVIVINAARTEKLTFGSEDCRSAITFFKFLLDNVRNRNDDHPWTGHNL